MPPNAMIQGPTSQPGSAHRLTDVDNAITLNTSQLSPHNPNSASSSSIEDFTLSSGSRSPSPGTTPGSSSTAPPSPGTTPGSSSTAPPSPTDPVGFLVPSSSPSSVKKAKQKSKSKGAKKKQKALLKGPSPTGVAPAIELSDLSTHQRLTSPASPSSPILAASSPDGSTLCPPSSAAPSRTTSAPTANQRPPRSSTWGTIRSVVPAPSLPSASNSLALITLAVSAFGLLFFGYRAYKMQIVDTMNGYVQNCYSWQQQQNGEGQMSKRCQSMLKDFEEGKMEPPYQIPKRNLGRQVNWEPQASEKWVAFRGLSQAKGTAGMTETKNPYGWLLGHKATSGPILVTFVVLLLGTTLAMRHVQHRTRREAPPFQSPARSDPQDVRVTRCFDTGEHKEIMRERGWQVIPHDPEEHSYLGRLGRVLRDAVEGTPALVNKDDDEERKEASEGERDDDNQSERSMSEMLNTWFGNDDEAETQTTGDERHGSNSSGRSNGSQMTHGFPSKVRLHHRRSVSGPANGDEKVRENLIELPAKGKTKNFFDPNTGEFIHLVPWSTQNHSVFYNEDDRSAQDEGVKEKGETKQKLVQMTAGGAALAGGKDIDAMFLKEMERLGAADVASGKETRDTVMMMLVGDCFGGLLTRLNGRAMPRIG